MNADLTPSATVRSTKPCVFELESRSVQCAVARWKRDSVKWANSNPVFSGASVPQHISGFSQGPRTLGIAEVGGVVLTSLKICSSACARGHPQG